MTSILPKAELNKLFADVLKEKHARIGKYTDFPFLIDLQEPFPLKLRVYLFNCTSSTGGRSAGEYKMQIKLPNQSEGKRAAVDYSDGRLPIIAAYVRLIETKGIFVLWDTYKHVDFAYSANMQVRQETLLKALYTPIVEYKRKNGEIVVISQEKYLYNALKHRVSLICGSI